MSHHRRALTPRLRRTALCGGNFRVASRPGVTLVECVVALVVGGLVAAAVASVMATQAALLRTASERTADAEALRIAAGVLRDELQWIDPRRDVRALAGDSVAVRLFRGGGPVCGPQADALVLAYAGTRVPDPDKDSVLVISMASEPVFALRAGEPTTCAGRSARRLAVEGELPADPVYALVFESGTYHVRDRALRYRLGREGRQPLTDERFATSGAAVTVAADTARVHVRVPWPHASHRPAATFGIPFANSPP